MEEPLAVTELVPGTTRLSSLHWKTGSHIIEGYLYSKIHQCLHS